MKSNSGFPMKALLAVLILLTLSIAFYIWKSSKESDTRSFRAIKVERGSIASTVLSTGVVKPENRVEVKPPIAGRAESVLVKEGDGIRKGQTLVWMSSTERAALLDAARARGPEELTKWEQLYRPTPILSPISGTIIQRQIEPGQTFAVTDPILVMSDKLIVEAQVDETDLARISIGQKASIVLDAYPDHQIPSRVGTIAYEATTVNNVTTYIVKVMPDEVPEFMRSGMTANVTFEIDARQDTLLLPAEAIKVHNGEAMVLMRSRPDLDPTPVSIETGMSDGKRTEVLRGVDEGDTVLIPSATLNEGPASSGTNPFSPSRPRRRR